MSNEAFKIFKLINEGITLDEIQARFSLSVREFSKYLKEIRDNGYNYTNSYYSDGTIISKKDPRVRQNEKGKTRIAVKSNILRCLFISDLHIGSVYSVNCLLDIVYNYAINHDIHIIINGGDVIDGIYPENKNKLGIKSLKGQANKVLDLYPYDKSICNFLLYGNHDYRGLIDEGFDVSRYLEEKRYDLVSLGYGESELLFKDDIVGIKHDLKSKKANILSIPNASITFRGHAHKCKNSFKDDKVIYIPALTEKDNKSYEYRPLIGFLDATFMFFDKKIERVNIIQLAIIDKEIRLANEEAIILKKVPYSQNNNTEE